MRAFLLTQALAHQVASQKNKMRGINLNIVNETMAYIMNMLAPPHTHLL